MKKAVWIAGMGLMLLSAPACAQLLEAKGEVQFNETNAQVRAFTYAGGGIVINLSVDSHPGTVTFELQAPNGASLGTQTGGVLTMGRWQLVGPQSGEYKLLVKPHQTTGHWQVRIDPVPSSRILYEQVFSGSLMTLVALAAVIWWRQRAHLQWRWFWAGAGIWTVGVALKFAVAVPLNPIFVGDGVHPPPAGLATGIIYCGLMTGIFEIGATLAAALVWQRLAADPQRAVAVGLGAGAFEALLLGLAAAAGCLVAIAFGQGNQVLKALAEARAFTPLFCLVGPVERLIAISAHTAGRVLVLQAVARKRWLGFWAGFAWLSLVDLIAGLALLTGMTKSTSLWWIELMILPFGILSIPLTRFTMRRWPQQATGELQIAALSSATGVVDSSHN